MSSRWSRFISVLALAGAATLVQAQPQPRLGAGVRTAQSINPRAPAGSRPGPGARPAMRKAQRQNMIDQLMSLPPEQQKEFMRNNPRFQRLPPRQQEMIQNRLEEFNSLPPQRREALRERFELFRRLPPEQQDRARALYRDWTEYPPPRRQELMRQFRQLRDAPPEERKQIIESDDFRNRFSSREQETLRGLVDLLPREE